MDLMSYLLERYAPVRVNLSDNTLSQMVNAVSQVNRFEQREVTTFDLCSDLINKHTKDLIRSGRSPATANVRRGYLRSLWTHSYRRGLNKHDPSAEEIPVKAAEPKKRPVAWSLEDVGRMLRQAQNVKLSPYHTFGPRHWEALLLLLYYTGLRIGAALQLKRSDLKGHLLIVPAGIQKDREEMHIRLPNELVSRLIALPRPIGEIRFGRDIGERLIPWPWSLHHPQEKLTRHILKPAGLPIDRTMKFHALRKTTATMMFAKLGIIAAKDALGHSSTKVTQRYIADPSTVDPSLAPSPSPMDVMPRLRVS